MTPAIRAAESDSAAAAVATASPRRLHAFPEKVEPLMDAVIDADRAVIRDAPPLAFPPELKSPAKRALPPMA